MNSDTIPFTFISQAASVSWQDIAYGWSRGFLGWKSVFDFAIAVVEETGEHSLPEVIELAGLSKEDVERITPALNSLSATEPSVTDESIRSKWLYIRLSWLYSNRSSFATH